MGRLSLMVLSLAVLLLAANSLPPVEAQLQNIVSEILNRYVGQRNAPMFSLAVSIPFNSITKTFDVTQIPDDANEVGKAIYNPNSAVYIGTKVVAAAVFNHNDGTKEHAEYRILQNLKSIIKNHNKENDLLLIYVYASPCAARCTNIKNKGNILKLLQGYKEYKVVFVFSKVFKPRDNTIIPTEDTEGALKNLGGTIGLGRIFRCDKVNYIMTCVNCNNNGNVAGWCYDDNQPPPNKAGGTQ